jgi:hypothetical protein
MFILGTQHVKMAIATAAASTAARAQDVDNRCSRDKCEARDATRLEPQVCFFDILLFFFLIFFFIIIYIYINYANEGAVGKIFL